MNALYIYIESLSFCGVHGAGFSVLRDRIKSTFIKNSFNALFVAGHYTVHALVSLLLGDSPDEVVADSAISGLPEKCQTESMVFLLDLFWTFYSLSAFHFSELWCGRIEV